MKRKIKVGRAIALALVITILTGVFGANIVYAENITDDTDVSVYCGDFVDQGTESCVESCNCESCDYLKVFFPG